MSLPGRQNLELFTGRKMTKNRGKFCILSNDATVMLIDLWSKETIQFVLENGKTSKETGGVYNALRLSNTFYLWLSSTKLLLIVDLRTRLTDLGSRVGAVVRALVSHQCVPGSIPGPGVTCGLSLLLVLYSAPRGFLRVLRFSPLIKNQYF